MFVIAFLQTRIKTRLPMWWKKQSHRLGYSTDYSGTEMHAKGSQKGEAYADDRTYPKGNGDV